MRNVYACRITALFLLVLPLYAQAQALPSGDLAKYRADKASLKLRAESGDSNAQYALGLLYEFPPDGTAMNREGAAYWYQRASEGGNVRGTFRLGLYYYDIDHDTPAYENFEKAANAGFAPAMTKLAEMILKSNLNGNGRYYAEPWFRKAAKAGDPDAQNDLGKQAWENYVHSSFNESNGHTAAEWFSMAAASGSCEAEMNLGGAYFNGVSVPQNAALADSAFQKAATCPGVAPWMKTKAEHFHMLINGNRLPSPTKSASERYQESIHVDTNHDKSANIIAGAIAAIGITAVISAILNPSTVSSDASSGSSSAAINTWGSQMSSGDESRRADEMMQQQRDEQQRRIDNYHYCGNALGIDCH